jgi:phage-related protein
MSPSANYKIKYDKNVKDFITSKGGHINNGWEYISSTEKFWITCHKGHEWETCWNVIQSGHWCPKCANEKNLSRIEDSKTDENEIRQFICNNKEGKLDSEWKYINNYEKFWVECKYGHRWQAMWANLRKGHWCPFCNKTIVLEKDVRSFIENKGGTLLPQWKYVKAVEKFEIRCKEGHHFKSHWDKIRLGHWCPYCYGNNKKDSSEIKKFIEIKGGELDTDWKYENSITKFWVTCKKGHRWETNWNTIRPGHWCPHCRIFKKEQEFREVMEDHFGVQFPSQRPKWLRYKTRWPLELDGYNKDKEIAFEYQGIQHYMAIGFSKDHLKYSALRERDIFKRDLCNKKGLKLIIMPYWISPKNWIIEIKNQYNELEESMHEQNMVDVYSSGDEVGYQTCDLYLAALFVSSGFKSTACRDAQTKRVYFTFEKNSLLLELKMKYFSREAKIDALTYADNIKSLKSLCHNIMTGSMVPRQ